MTWRDAYAEKDEGEYDGDDYLCYTVGYLLPPTDLFLRVAAEKCPDTYRGVTHIPHQIVVSQEVLHPQSLQVIRTETM